MFGVSLCVCEISLRGRTLTSGLIHDDPEFSQRDTVPNHTALTSLQRVAPWSDTESKSDKNTESCECEAGVPRFPSVKCIHTGFNQICKVRGPHEVGNSRDKISYKPEATQSFSFVTNKTNLLRRNLSKWSLSGWKELTVNFLLLQVMDFLMH